MPCFTCRVFYPIPIAVKADVSYMLVAIVGVSYTLRLLHMGRTFYSLTTHRAAKNRTVAAWEVIISIFLTRPTPIRLLAIMNTALGRRRSD